MLTFFLYLKSIIGPIWHERHKRYFHWHFVFTQDKEMLDIAWKHLHKAEIAYKKEQAKLIEHRKDVFVAMLDDMANEYYGKGGNMAKGKNKQPKEKKKAKKKK